MEASIILQYFILHVCKICIIWTVPRSVASSSDSYICMDNGLWSGLNGWMQGSACQTNPALARHLGAIVSKHGLLNELKLYKLSLQWMRYALKFFPTPRSILLDSQVEASCEDSVHLLAICFCHISVASFILLAKSLAYSTASTSFFLVCCFFKAAHWHLSCRTYGITRHWILGTLVLGFLSSLFNDFLTLYWQTSSLERWKTFQILLALLGLNPWFWL